MPSIAEQYSITPYMHFEKIKSFLKITMVYDKQEGKNAPSICWSYYICVANEHETETSYKLQYPCMRFRASEQ